MKRHTAYLTGEYPRATDTFIQREVAELRRSGVEVTTISVRRTGDEHMVGPEQREEAAGTHYLLPAWPWQLIAAHAAALFRSPGRYFRALKLAWKTAPPGLRGFFLQCCYFAEAGLVGAVMRRTGADRLHNHFANSSCQVSMLASAMTGAPFSFTLHGPAIFFEPGRWSLGEKIRRADAVACISHFCRSQGMAFVDPEHWEKMRIIHCGVDPDRFATKTHHGPGTRLVFVGRLAPVKGLPVLLDAMAVLPPETQLTVVGDGGSRAQLEARVEALGLASRVRFVGSKSQEAVRAILAEADLFVLASFAEGVPVVLMEAMASGLPVVATRIAGISELVEDGVSGFLVPPGHAASLADPINTLIADAVLRQRMGEAGRSKVAAEFDQRIEAARMVTLQFEKDSQSIRPEPAGYQPPAPVVPTTESDVFDRGVA